MQAVYIDTLFFVNFVINYIVLLTSAKICAVPAARIRIAAGALLGGAYAVAAVFTPLGFLLNGAVKIAVGVLMALIVFGGERRFLRAVLVFFSVSAAFGGVAVAVMLLEGRDLYHAVLQPVSAKVLLLSFGVTYAVLALVFRRTGKTGGVEVLPVSAVCDGRSVKFRALRDTGNSLTDPLTGVPVIVAELSAVRHLLPAGTALTAAALSEPAETLTRMPKEVQRKFRLVPYSAVGVGGSLLLALRADEIAVGGRGRRGALIALSPTPVSDGGAYSALVGADWG